MFQRRKPRPEKVIQFPKGNLLISKDMTFTARSRYIPPFGTGVACLFSPAAVAEIDPVGPNTLSLEAPSWPYDTSWMANTAHRS